MNENSDHRVGPGLVWLLLYQCILALLLGAEGYNFATEGAGAGLSLADRLLGWLASVLCVGGALAIVWASVGMLRRRPRAYLVSMICHLLGAIIAMSGVIACGIVFIVADRGGHEEKAWAPMFLLFALLWLPVAVLACWAFVYVRRLRTRLS